jgi:hypothetical protein
MYTALSLALQNGHSLRVLRIEALSRISGPLKEDKRSEQRKSIITAFINCVFHHTLIIMTIRSNIILFVRHTARIWEIVNAYNILVGKPVARRSRGRGIWSSGRIL